MELALAEAKAEYERENGKRFEIIMREISPEEKQRILDSLTDRQRAHPLWARGSGRTERARPKAAVI